MPWLETNPMDERVRFIVALNEGVSEYPAHFETRRVRTTGAFRLHGRDFFLSEVLPKETIELEEVADGVWSIFFYHVLLASLNKRDVVAHGMAGQHMRRAMRDDAWRWLPR